MNIKEGFGWYYQLCGMRGVVAAITFRHFGRPPELAVVPPGSNFPVYLRMNTSDFCAYKDVLISQTKQYDPGALDFTPKVIVDAGAHIGMASILFARKYPSAKILAIEPEPSNFAALVRNTSPYKTIIPIQAALWKETGEVALGRSNAHVKGAFQILESGELRVRAITMEKLMCENEIDAIDILKVDIEGAEKEVFVNCAWIKKIRVIAIELHDRIAPGCRSVVENAANEFYLKPQGEVTFFFRKCASSLEPSTKNISQHQIEHGYNNQVST